MATKKNGGWGGLSGDPEKDRKEWEKKKSEQEKATRATTSSSNQPKTTGWAGLTGDPNKDRQNRVQELYAREEQAKRNRNNRGMIDTGIVGIYDQMAREANRTGNKELWDYADAGFKSYQASMQKLWNEDQRRSKGAWNRGDLSRSLQGTADEADYYTKMADYAAKAGMQGLYDNATKRLKDLGTEYTGYQAQADKARKDYLGQLKETNKGAYYGETLTKEQIEGQLRQLEKQRSIIGEISENPNWTSGLGGSDVEKANTVAKRAKELDEQIAIYQSALRERNRKDNEAEFTDIENRLLNSPDLQRRVSGGVEKYRKQEQSNREALEWQVVNDSDTGYGQAWRELANGGTGELEHMDVEFMTDDQKRVFYALYAENPEKANEYARWAQSTGKEAYLQEISTQTANLPWYKRADEWAVGSLQNLVAGLDPYGEWGQRQSEVGEAKLAGVSEGWTEKGLFDKGWMSGEWDAPIIGKTTLGSVAQLGSSMLQSGAIAVPAMLIGDEHTALRKTVEFLGTALMGSSAAASDYRERLKAGWDKEAAMQHSLAAGINEALFEYVSLDKLVNQDVTAGFFKSFFTQGGIEASEEFCTTLANTLADHVQAKKWGYDTKVEERAKELMSQGVAYGEANLQAEKEWTTELINDALGGFISGGVMTGFHYAGAKVMSGIRNTTDLARSGEQSMVPEQYRDAQWYENATGKTAINLEGLKLNNNLKKAVSDTEGGDAAVRAFAQDNKIKVKEELTEKNLSKVEQTLTKQMTEAKTVEGAEQVYQKTVEQYGEGIRAVADQALSRSVAQITRNPGGTVTQTINENRAAVENITDERAKKAAQKGLDTAVLERAYVASEESERKAGSDYMRNHGNPMTMEHTVTNEDGTTKQVGISGLVKTKDGVQVQLADGSTVTVNDLQTDGDTKDVIQTISLAGLTGKDAADFFAAYTAEKEAGKVADPYRWSMEYAMAYDRGRQGSITLDEAVKQSKTLGEETVRLAYNAGAKAGEAMTAEQRKKLNALLEIREKGATGRAGTVTVNDSVDVKKLSKAQQRQLEAVKKIARIFGIDVEVFSSSVKDGKFVGENGSYVDGKIRLDINAKLNYETDVGSGLIATMSHEMTHFIQDYAPELYSDLKQFVLSQLVKQHGTAYLDRLIQQKQNRSSQALSRSQAEDEVVADACEMVLTDSKAIQTLAEENPSLFDKILQWVKDFFDSVREMLSDTPYTSEEAQTMQALEAKVKEAFGELWDKGITEAVRTHDRVGSIKNTAKNSDRDTEYLELAKDPKKNAARLQEMVDETAKAAGYTVKAYHGTPKKFNVFSKDLIGSTTDYGWFGRGFYFSTKKDVADVYAGYLNESNTIEAYLKIQNPFVFEDYPGADDMSPGEIMSAVLQKKYGKRGEMTEYDKAERSRDFSEWLKRNKYDGARAWSQIMILDSEQAKRTDPVTYDDSGNVIPLSKRFNTENQDIRFSMREPVETTDRLIAWHNMNEDALRSALELGGLAMPSWAIKTADRSHTSYGKISVIAPRELVDPKLNRSSMIFGGDAWTPVFPDIDYDVSFEAAEDLYDEITGLIGENVMRELGGASIDTQNIAQQLSNNGGAVSNYYKNNVALRYAYLKSIGKDINVPRREVRLDQSGQYDNQAVQMFADRLVNGKKSLQYFRSMTGREVMQQEDLKKAISDVMVARHGEEVRDLYAPDELSFRNVEAMLSAANRFFENGGDVPSETDRYALAKEIDKVIDEAAYEKWIGEKLNKTVTKKGVYNGKDPFTPSGNRRSFDALHYAYNLANIVKAMKSQPKQGRTQFLSGPGSVKGAALKSYNTVEQVRKDRGRLVDSAEEGQAAYDAYNRNLEDILDRMSKNGDRFDAADALIEVFQHAKTEAAIYNYMQRELKDWYNISRELAHDAYELIGQINALPMEYFEGKTYDAVRFDETAAVVVPDNIDPALKQQLENAGARVVEYAAGDDTDRLEKVNSVENAKFSEREYDTPSDLELMENAAQALTEAGGEEYWKALLKSAPELAKDGDQIKGLMKDYRAQAKKLRDTEVRLAEAKRQLTTTDRKLRTNGITGVALSIMKELGAGDAKERHVAKQIAEILTNAYQKALDQIDAGANAKAVMDTVYNGGVVKAADILAEQATHSEKQSYKWFTVKLGQYYAGAEGRQALLDTVNAAVTQDFVMNRYREAVQATAADRIVERVEGRMQRQIDETKSRNAELTDQNAKLNDTVKTLRENWENASNQVDFLNQQLKDARENLRSGKQLSADEQKKAQRKIESLENSIKAKQKEAETWKKLALRNESLLKAALKSKNADLDALRVQMGRNASEAQKKQAALVEKLARQAQREKDILAGKLKPLAMQRLLKAEREAAAKKMAEHKDEVFAGKQERRKQSELRNRIRNLADEMKRRMTNPSERAYVPAALYGSMTKLADVLDSVLSPAPGSKAEARYRAVMDAIHGLAREYEGIEKIDDYTYSSEFDEEIQNAISEIERVLERKDASWIDEMTKDTKKGVRELTTAELQQVYDIMRQIDQTMKNAGKVLGNARWGTIAQAMESIASQQKKLKSRNAAGWLERVRRGWRLDTLSTMRAAELMSNWDRDSALYQMVQAIEQGTVNADDWNMRYNKSMEALKTGKNEKEYRQAMTKKLDYGVTDTTDGLPVKMTKMQALQILMTAEREAHNDKLVHLQTGGATIRDAIAIQDGKARTAKTQNIEVTPELLQAIRDSLTDWDKAYMKTVRDYFRKEGKKTNEVLYKLKHRVLQTEEFYIPYTVDKNYLDTKLDGDQAMNMWVKTPGSTNPLQKNASQPVIIDGLDTVMSRHVREIADYIGLAVPIRDFSKVFNGKIKTGLAKPLPVKETIFNNFGQKGLDLLTDAVIDVQGGNRTGSYRTAVAEYLNKLQGAFVRSALLINPSVTIKQAASYTAAESILSHAALIAGNRPTVFSVDESRSPSLIAQIFASPSGKTATRIYNEIDEHTSMHYIRRQGMSYTELANQAQHSGKISRTLGMIGASMEQNAFGHNVRKAGQMLDPTAWIQRMDVATTAALWVACKEQAKLDGKQVGSADYWQHTTELYERVLRETQPMYDSLHRTNFQKDRTGIIQFLFPFRTVPVQNHGQIASAFDAMVSAKQSGDKAKLKDAAKFFGKTVWAQTESAVVFSVMTFLAAALKRKTKKYRDEDEEISMESILEGILKDTGGVWLSNLLPLTGSELWSWGSKALDKLQGKSGYYYDTFSVGVVDLMNDVDNAFTKFIEATGKASRGEAGYDKMADAGVNMLLTVGKALGIPLPTIKTYAEGFFANVKDIAEGRIPALNDESWERKNAVNVSRYWKAWTAGDDGKMDAVLSEMRQNYLDDGRDPEKADELTRNALTSAAMDRYDDGELDLDGLAKFLERTGLWDGEKLQDKLAGLIREAYKAGEFSQEDTIKKLKDLAGYDEDKAWKKANEWESKNEHADDEEYSYSQYEDLTAALDNGSSFDEAAAPYLEHGYSEENLRKAAADHVRDRFDAGEISENDAIRLLEEYKGMDGNAAWKKVQEWKAKREHSGDEDYSYSQYDAIDEALAKNGDISGLVKELTDHGVKEDSIKTHVKGWLVDRYVEGKTTEAALKNQLSRYCGIVAKEDVDKILKDANSKKAYGVAYSQLDEEYRAGNISSANLKQALMQYGGLSSSDADKKIRWYDLQKSKPELDISEGLCNTWYDGTSKSRENGHEGAKAAGMSIEAYIEARKYLDTIKDQNGNNTGEDEVIRALAGMNLTARQKDALYYERYKGTNKKIRKTW